MIHFFARRLGVSRVLCACLAGLPLLVSAQTSRNGLLWLDIEPAEAEVSLDDVYLDAGVWLISLAPGPHALLIRKAGFRTWGTRVEIFAGESVFLAPRLETVFRDPLMGDPPLAPALEPPYPNLDPSPFP